MIYLHRPNIIYGWSHLMYSGLSPINVCGPVWAGEAPGDILKWAHQIFALLCDDITAWAHLTQCGPWPINVLWPRVSRWSTWRYSWMGPPDLCTIMWRYNRMGPFDLEWSMANKRIVAQSEQVSHILEWAHQTHMLLFDDMIAWAQPPRHLTKCTCGPS